MGGRVFVGRGVFVGSDVLLGSDVSVAVGVSVGVDVSVGWGAPGDDVYVSGSCPTASVAAGGGVTSLVGLACVEVGPNIAINLGAKSSARGTLPKKSPMMATAIQINKAAPTISRLARV